MAKNDVVVTGYLEIPEHFCDFFNGTIFNGAEILKPEMMETLSGENKKRIPGQKKAMYVERRRDTVKRAGIQGIYGVFAIDNQSEVHYGMPVRSMLYDALDYTSQMKEWERKHRAAKDWSGSAGFLSGMEKDDYLIPVFNLVFYYGDDPWDGFQNLKDMFRVPPKLEPYRKYLPEYEIHLICPEDVNPENFRTEWKEIFELLQLSRDGDGMMRYAWEHREKLQKMDIDTKEFIMTVLHGTQIWEEEKEKGEFDMCKAFEQIKAMGFCEGREEGIKEGMEQGISAFILDNLEEGKGQEEILCKLQKRFSLNEKKAMEHYTKVAVDFVNFS
ncbi:MAG: hypothetical protein ACOYBL_07305 [Lachnospiraceae bacterium]|jgi:hypothetical protein